MVVMSRAGRRKKGRRKSLANAQNQRGRFEFVSPAATGSVQMDPKLMMGVLPHRSDWLMDCAMKKLNCMGQWSLRRVTLTKGYLYICEVDKDTIRDAVPLHEIISIAEKSNFEAAVRHELESAVEAWRASSSWHLTDVGSGQFAFEVKTAPDGHNAGRSYLFDAHTADSREEWTAAVTAVAAAALQKLRREKQNRLRRLRAFIRRAYVSPPFQTAVAVLIAANFVANVVQAELRARPGSALEAALGTIDTFFTAIFALELAFNLFANWFWPFFTDGWSCFDFLVVSISLVSTGVDNVPGISVLRLMRAFRVLRLFARLASLRKIVNSLTASILPVSNAFLIMGLVVAIYAILGVSFFSDTDVVNFYGFFRSFYTFFSVSTGDGWSDIVRGLFDDSGNMNGSTVLLFVSFHVAITWTVLQVVVAVLIENFTLASDREKSSQRRAAIEPAANAARQRRRATRPPPPPPGPLDPILAALAHFNTATDLSERIATLFQMLDTDGSGALSYTELSAGLRRLRLSPAVHLSLEDFDHITEHGALCDGGQGELSLEGFKRLVRIQLKDYVHRQTAYAIATTSDKSPQFTILVALERILSTVERVRDFLLPLPAPLRTTPPRPHAAAATSPPAAATGTAKDGPRGAARRRLRVAAWAARTFAARPPDEVASGEGELSGSDVESPGDACEVVAEDLARRVRALEEGLRGLECRLGGAAEALREQGHFLREMLRCLPATGLPMNTAPPPEGATPPTPARALTLAIPEEAEFNQPLDQPLPTASQPPPTTVHSVEPAASSLSALRRLRAFTPPAAAGSVVVRPGTAMAADAHGVVRAGVLGAPMSWHRAAAARVAGLVGLPPPSALTALPPASVLVGLSRGGVPVSTLRRAAAARRMRVARPTGAAGGGRGPAAAAAAAAAAETASGGARL